MNSSKVAPSSDAEWRKFYEGKCRQQRKEIADLTYKLEDLQADYDHLSRKVDHGCAGFNCNLCDKKTN